MKREVVSVKIQFKKMVPFRCVFGHTTMRTSLAGKHVVVRYHYQDTLS